MGWKTFHAPPPLNYYFKAQMGFRVPLKRETFINPPSLRLEHRKFIAKIPLLVLKGPSKTSEQSAKSRP